MIAGFQIALVACIVVFIYILTPALEGYTDTATTAANSAVDADGNPTDIGETQNVKGFAYDPNDPNNVEKAADTFDKDFNSSKVGNAKQNFKVDTKLVQETLLYNEPGSFPIRGVGYVPTYDDLYKSTTTNMSQVDPVSDSVGKGFCGQLANSKLDIEQKCNSLNKDVCGSTSCCVLFAGQKCVAGNEQGPSNRANYSNFLLKNRDYYYYQGKCYGNCNNRSFP